MEDVIALMRRTVSFDYDPYPSPRAMLQSGGVDIAVVGRVQTVRPALLAGGPEPLGAVVVGLKPVETWKADTSLKRDSVDYWFHRPTNLGISEYREAMTDGTRVVLFGDHMAASPRFLDGGPGTRVYSPVPQGLFLPVPDHGLVNVWGEDLPDRDWTGIHTVADLRQAVGK